MGQRDRSATAGFPRLQQAFFGELFNELWDWSRSLGQFVPIRSLPRGLSSGIDVDESTEYLWESRFEGFTLSFLKLLQNSANPPADRPPQSPNRLVSTESEAAVGGGLLVEFIQAEGHERKRFSRFAAGIRQDLVD